MDIVGQLVAQAGHEGQLNLGQHGQQLGLNLAQTAHRHAKVRQTQPVRFGKALAQWLVIQVIGQRALHIGLGISFIFAQRSFAARLDGIRNRPKWAQP